MADMSHAMLMDGVYRRQRHFYDLTRKYYLLGRDQMLAELNPPPSATVLELGCGTGRNLIAAARRYPQAAFFGVDISEQMLQTARDNVRRAGLDDRIVLSAGDASSFDPAGAFGLAQFDRVFISYAVSMIPPWRSAMAHGLRLTARGGSFHLVDFGMQNGLPQWFRNALFAWLRRFHVEPRAELHAHLRGIALSEKSAQLRQLYRGYAVLAKVQR